MLYGPNIGQSLFLYNPWASNGYYLFEEWFKKEEATDQYYPQSLEYLLSVSLQENFANPESSRV